MSRPQSNNVVVIKAKNKPLQIHRKYIEESDIANSRQPLFSFSNIWKK